MGCPESNKCHECYDDCGCDIEITSLACIRHNGTDLPCIKVVKGDTLEVIMQKINNEFCELQKGLDGDDGQGIDHISYTGEGEAGEPGTTSEYTVWGDAAESINLGTFIVYNGGLGQGIDHTSFTSTDGGTPEPGISGQTDTYTIWGDAGETIELGTFVVYNGDGYEATTCDYDSGWKTLKKVATGSPFGLPPFVPPQGGIEYPRPRIRVKCGTVFLEGYMVLPLSFESPPGTLKLMTDPYDYAIGGKAMTALYDGIDGGYISSSTSTAKSVIPIMPPVLAPSAPHIMGSLSMINRSIVDSGETYSLNLSSVLSQYRLNTDGTFEIRGIRDLSPIITGGGVSLTAVSNSPINQLISSVTTGGVAATYAGFRTQYVGATDERISPADTMVLYPLTFDGTVVSNLGGFLIKMTTSYPLNAASTLEDVIAGIGLLS